jgi:hypothetical protein
MGNKPKYIEEIESLAKQNQQAIAEIRAKTIEMEQWQKDMRTDQDKILIRTGEIHTALMGTEYDKSTTNGHGGGIVKRLGVIEKFCDMIELWKERIVIRDAIIWIVVGGALTAIWSLLLSNWSSIFHGPIPGS